MRKMTILFFLLMMAPIVVLGETKTVEFEFEYPTNTATDFVLYANESIINEIQEDNSRIFQMQIEWNRGIQIYALEATNGEKHSEMSPAYALNTNSEDGKIEVSQKSITSNIHVMWEPIDGIDDYVVEYYLNDVKQVDELGSLTDYDLINLPDGTYTISVKSEAYPMLAKSITVTLPVTPLLAPTVKMESFGLTDQLVIVAIDKTKVESRVDEIRMYVSGTYARALNMDGEIITAANTGDANCVYANINTISSLPAFLKVAPYSKTQLEMVFVATTTYDAENDEESPPTITYKLLGDLTNTQANGVPYKSIKSDSTDLSLIRANLNKAVAKRSLDYINDPSIYAKFPLTPTERADFDYNGVVNSVDYAFFAKYYGKSGAIY